MTWFDVTEVFLKNSSGRAILKVSDTGCSRSKISPKKIQNFGEAEKKLRHGVASKAQPKAKNRLEISLLLDRYHDPEETPVTGFAFQLDTCSLSLDRPAGN